MECHSVFYMKTVTFCSLFVPFSSEMFLFGSICSFFHVKKGTAEYERVCLLACIDVSCSFLTPNVPCLFLVFRAKRNI